MSLRRTPQSRRRFRRVTVRLLVDFVAAGRVRCEYATTLGAGGLFVETEEPVAPGTPVKVRFRLPGGARLHEIEGRVAWWQPPAPDATRACGMGISFTDAVAMSALARELDQLGAPDAPEP